LFGNSPAACGLGVEGGSGAVVVRLASSAYAEKRRKKFPAEYSDNNDVETNSQLSG
jgi:hypothetical protein